MDRLIQKADRKAVAALKENIKSSDHDVISATMPAAKVLSRLSANEASRLIIAFDNHIASVEQIVEDALKDLRTRREFRREL